MKTFNELGLQSAILKAVEDMQFVNATPVQESVIPVIINQTEDIIALAQTGTGKTAAFGLPLLELINPNDRFPQALILSPTRELCIQIAKDLKEYAKYMPSIRVTPVYGGASIVEQMRNLRSGTHIIVATPGRMVDLIKRQAADITQIKYLVLDEADEMLSMGFQDEVDVIFEQTPKIKRTFLFSATMSKDVYKITSNFMQNPIEMTMGIKNQGAENIQHIYYTVPGRQKYFALKRILDSNPDIYGIIFCRTKNDTQELSNLLIQDGYNAEALHGDMAQASREYVMNKFRTRTLQMLVATDVAARGIDVDDLTHVINYGIPEDTEVYTHRSGRTGRAGKFGTSITISNTRDNYKIKEIEKMIKKKFKHDSVPSVTDICTTQMVHLVDKIANVTVNLPEIKPFLAPAYEKFNEISKEELIQKMLSSEFNRFLDYYRHEDEQFNPEEDSKLIRVFINIGKVDGLNNAQLRAFLLDAIETHDAIIKNVDAFDNFSFFETNQPTFDELKNVSRKLEYNGRKVRMDKAEQKRRDRNSDDGGGRRRRSDDFGGKKREGGGYGKRNDDFGGKSDRNKPSYGDKKPYAKKEWGKDDNRGGFGKSSSGSSPVKKKRF